MTFIALAYNLSNRISGPHIPLRITDSRLIFDKKCEHNTNSHRQYVICENPAIHLKREEKIYKKPNPRDEFFLMHYLSLEFFSDTPKMPQTSPIHVLSGAQPPTTQNIFAKK